MLKRCLGLVGVFALAACADSHELFIASHTVLGVNAGVNTAQTTGHLMVGYDRTFVTDPPASVKVDGKADEHDAMAVLSCSEVVVDGIFLSGFTEHLATGVAAKNFAHELKSDLDANEFFKCTSDTASK
jgi:hypothetical protein